MLGDHAQTAIDFLSRQTLVTRPGLMPKRVRDRAFALMARNAERPMEFLKLPINWVVELGSQMKL